MTLDLDAIEARMDAADGARADDPRIIEILEETADDVPALTAEVRRLTEENQQLRNRSKGDLFDDLMSNLPPDLPRDAYRFVDDDD
jgi:hypothetical protein